MIKCEYKVISFNHGKDAHNCIDSNGNQIIIDILYNVWMPLDETDAEYDMRCKEIIGMEFTADLIRWDDAEVYTAGNVIFMS